MKLYIYDHCPYCVRVLFVIGLKKINCSIDYFANDDIEGPVNLVGVKQVPILQKNDDQCIAESLYIIDYLDNIDNKPIFFCSSKGLILKNWLKDIRIAYRYLMMPRFVRYDLPEFQTQAAKNYFTMNKQAMIGDFASHLKNSPELIKFFEIKLAELEILFKNDLTLNEKLSFDDIIVWSILRGLTGVKNLNFTAKIKYYIDYYAEKCNIDLYYSQQI